jgi:hypothetical protein
MTYLSIVQNACDELSQPRPMAVAASTDQQIVQLRALVNRAGKDLADRYPWQALRQEFNFTTTATEAQPATMIPADFLHWVPNSFFNRSTRRPIVGPITPQQWQWLKARVAYASIYLAWMERANQFLIIPTPPAGQNVYGEYMSKNWALSAGGTPQNQFVADADTTFLDEDLITLGAIWRWLQRKGLDYAEAMSDYERMLERAMGHDGGQTSLLLAPRPVDPLRAQVGEGNFGI